jgi:hypothetical protein
MTNQQGFSDKDIAELRQPNRRQATRAGPRVLVPPTSPVQAHDENNATPALAHAAQLTTGGDSTTDLFLKEFDKTLATFSSKCNLLFDLDKDVFFEHAWKVKCVGLLVRDGRVYVTLETLAGETPDLSAQDQGKLFDIPVSRGKCVSLPKGSSGQRVQTPDDHMYGVGHRHTAEPDRVVA